MLQIHSALCNYSLGCTGLIYIKTFRRLLKKSFVKGN